MEISMRPVSTRELRWLLGTHVAPCVSIYVPSDRPGNQAADVRRFEERVAEASGLLATGLAPHDAETLLEPLRELAKAPLWQRRRDALAVFRSRDVFTHYRIPAHVPELTVVSDSFHTRPLVRYLNSNRRHFYVLAIAPSEIAVLEGTLERLAPVDREDLPPELDDALRAEHGRAYLAVLPPADAAPGRRARGVNGHGREGLARWFKTIDRALWTWLKDDPAPLVLAGSAQHHEAYRAASRYPELLDEGVEEDIAAMGLAELHGKVLELIRSRDVEVLGAILARLASALSLGRAHTDLAVIARAAVEGRVGMLLFAADAQQWGRLDRRTGALELSARQRDDVDADVIDDLCEVVLLAGGDVHELPENTLATPVAAIYRS
jgi:hypothetical protein